MKSKLKVELLTSDKTNKSILENFSANKQGKGLEKYLKNSAWIEDISGATKVYLVKDRETGAIVFFLHYRQDFYINQLKKMIIFYLRRNGKL